AAFRTQCTIRNAGTDEIFPRRSCAEIFRLSPYCPARAIRTAVFPTKHQPAMRRQIKEFGQTRSPLRFFHTFLSPYCPETPIRTASLRSHHSAREEFGPTRSPLRFFHTFQGRRGQTDLSARRESNRKPRAVPEEYRSRRRSSGRFWERDLARETPAVCRRATTRSGRWLKHAT